ncbi:MAG TPA: CinA family protein [Bacteroidia bacterium]|jgi:nicotinamide-nucleotide amidase|nr:CinA family protein [Bacteroidia bacterium]
MKSLSAEIGKKLRLKKKTIAIAESCTGGYLSHLITQIPGSSDYFTGSVISYSDKVKQKALGVKKKILKKYGAVSSECAGEMVSGIRKEFKVDYALATTGIAGPQGAIRGKPVGTVYIALANKKNLLVERFHFKGTRQRVIEQSANKALEMLKNLLDG